MRLASTALALGVAIATAACGAGGASSSTSSTTTPTTTTPTSPTVDPQPVTSGQLSLVLSRPEDTSMSASVRVTADGDVYLEYGTTSGRYATPTSTVAATSSAPVVLAMSGLAPDTTYYYRARYRPKSESSFRADTEHTFHTKRLSGQTFTFAIQADPHMDGNSSAAVYSRTLANELSDKPDFLVDLGDTSMVEKCVISGSDNCATPAPATVSTVAARYQLARSFFDQVCHSMPLLMVLGNHDGETGWADTPSGGQLDTWSLQARRAYFANPEPDRFYSGSSTSVAGVGLRQNYYAFEWGDALFVVLDPYTYTATKPGTNGWGWTLGSAQYQW
ncbi:MAG: metallophosphoesterase, partial [Acidobacteriota bacterium]